MWLLLLTSTSMAAPVGDPIPHPDHGRLIVTALGDAEKVPTVDQDCSEGDACDALYTSSIGGVEGQWNPRHGFGVAASLGYQAVRISEANLRGGGLYYGLSLRGALPLSERWWLAGRAHWSGSATRGAPVSESTSASSRQWSGDLSTLLAWSDIKEGPSIWAGAQASLLWFQTVSPMGDEDELSISLRPQYPLSAVAGLSLRSRKLGLPWGDSPRITAGIEGRAGQASGVGTWVSLAW